MWGYAPLYVNPLYKNQSFSGKVWPVSPVESRNPYSPIKLSENQPKPSTLRNKSAALEEHRDRIPSFSFADSVSGPLAIHVGTLFTETWLQAVKQSAPVHVNPVKVADLYEYKERPASRICWLS